MDANHKCRVENFDNEEMLFKSTQIFWQLLILMPRGNIHKTRQNVQFDSCQPWPSGNNSFFTFTSISERDIDVWLEEPFYDLRKSNCDVWTGNHRRMNAKTRISLIPMSVLCRRRWRSKCDCSDGSDKSLWRFVIWKPESVCCLVRNRLCYTTQSVAAIKRRANRRVRNVSFVDELPIFGEQLAIKLLLIK